VPDQPTIQLQMIPGGALCLLASARIRLRAGRVEPDAGDGAVVAMEVEGEVRSQNLKLESGGPLWGLTCRDPGTVGGVDREAVRARVSRTSSTRPRAFSWA
jgi:hypothetical protein